MEESCIGCKYRRDNAETDEVIPDAPENSLQSCKRWVTSDDLTVLCNPTGGEYGDEGPDCIKMSCPAHCQYPYPKEAYVEDELNDSIWYEGTNQFPTLESGSTDMDNYLTFAINPEKLNPDITTYQLTNIPELDLKCGELVPTDVANGVTDMQFPSTPNITALTNSIEFINDINMIGIQWDKIKQTPMLIQQYEQFITDNTVIIDGNIIPLSNNGIELEWWNDTYSEDDLRSIMPESIRTYIELEDIHQETGFTLQNVFPTHTVENMVSQQVMDWLQKRNLDVNPLPSQVAPINNNTIQDNNITPETATGSTASPPLSLSSFFGVSDVTNPEFESCINDIMSTTHDDTVHLTTIGNMSHFTNLGDPMNINELNYIEAKMIKFILTKNADIIECLDIIHVTDQICQTGISDSSVQIIGALFNMNVSDIDNEAYKSNLKNISRRLSKYIPNLIYKMIDISEMYEKYKCNGEPHKNTLLLKEMYQSLIEKNKYSGMDMPNLGIKDFFDSFQKNIITKVILLMFIAFILSKLIGLFTIKYTINGDK
jgi:hypothetical protein